VWRENELSLRYSDQGVVGRQHRPGQAAATFPQRGYIVNGIPSLVMSTGLNSFGVAWYTEMIASSRERALARLPKRG
jgi:hypothetical protein